MASSIPAHMRQPMTAREWTFVRLLLSQADERAAWGVYQGWYPRHSCASPVSRGLVAQGMAGRTLTPPQLTLIAIHVQAGAAISGVDLLPAALDFWFGDERDALDLALHTWNGDPENHEPGHFCGLASSWMGYYADKLLLAAGQHSTDVREGA